MKVSSITHDKNGKPQVFVTFTDGRRTAEGRIPGCRILTQEGFSEEEVEALNQYMKKEKGTILTIAKRIDPMKDFLGGFGKG